MATTIRDFPAAPVVFSEPFRNEYKVAAVVSAYRVVDEPVYVGEQDTGLTYKYNTGIIVTHSIDSAVRIAQANPVGALRPGLCNC